MTGNGERAEQRRKGRSRQSLSLLLLRGPEGEGEKCGEDDFRPRCHKERFLYRKQYNTGRAHASAIGALSTQGRPVSLRCMVAGLAESGGAAVRQVAPSHGLRSAGEETRG